MWNLGKIVRSADFQYLLHCVSLGEKHELLEDLWNQLTNEMALLQGNFITVCGKQCTAEQSFSWNLKRRICVMSLLES